MIQEKLVDYIKEQIKYDFPNFPIEIVEEINWQHNAITHWMLTQAPPQIDEFTLLWCIQKLCLSGKTYQEALQLLEIIKPNTESTQREP